MRFVTLTCVPFGPFVLNSDLVSALVPPSSDPFHGLYSGQPYGCCVHVGSETFRVQESLPEVLELLLEPTEKILADPEPPAQVQDIASEAPAAPPKKGKKRGA